MRLYTTTIDANDVPRLARWWADALRWQLVYTSDDEAAVVPPHAEERELADRDAFDRVGSGLCFVKVPEAKQVKNRIHLDFAPHSTEDRDAIVERLVGLGATRADVGQTEDATWVVRDWSKTVKALAAGDGQSPTGTPLPRIRNGFGWSSPSMRR